MVRRTSGRRALLALEVAAFVVLALALGRLLGLWVWRYAGPIAMLTTIGVLTFYLRTRGLSWRLLGLHRLEGKRAKALIPLKALLALVAFAAAVVPIVVLQEKLGVSLPGPENALLEGRFSAVPGSAPHYVLWLAIIWLSAAFGEEMFFRGYLVTRFEELFAGLPLASPVAVVFSAVLFGYAHLHHQGLRGAVLAGAIGIAFGTMFLLFRRNLWPLVLLHGLIDSAALTVTFLGLR